MNRHRTDLVALLFGLAFTIAGALVIVAQASDTKVNPHWGAAVGPICLGVVALVVTIARARTDRVAPGAPPEPVEPVEPFVSSEDRSD